MSASQYDYCILAEFNPGDFLALAIIIEGIVNSNKMLKAIMIGEGTEEHVRHKIKALEIILNHVDPNQTLRPTVFVEKLSEKPFVKLFSDNAVTDLHVQYGNFTDLTSLLRLSPYTTVICMRSFDTLVKSWLADPVVWRHVQLCIANMRIVKEFVQHNRADNKKENDNMGVTEHSSDTKRSFVASLLKQCHSFCVLDVHPEFSETIGRHVINLSYKAEYQSEFLERFLNFCVITRRVLLHSFVPEEHNPNSLILNGRSEVSLYINGHSLFFSLFFSQVEKTEKYVKVGNIFIGDKPKKEMQTDGFYKIEYFGSKGLMLHIDQSSIASLSHFVKEAVARILK